MKLIAVQNSRDEHTFDLLVPVQGSRTPGVYASVFEEFFWEFRNTKTMRRLKAGEEVEFTVEPTE